MSRADFAFDQGRLIGVAVDLLLRFETPIETSRDGFAITSAAMRHLVDEATQLGVLALLGTVAGVQKLKLARVHQVGLHVPKDARVVHDQDLPRAMALSHHTLFCHP